MHSSRCDLCEEIARDGWLATGQLDEPFSRLLHRSQGIDVMAGLGSLTAGYLLVIPHEHVRSAGELARRDAQRFWGIAKAFARRVTETFSCTTFLVEHGSSGPKADGKSCIEHAHAHIFPVPHDAELASFSPSGSVPASEEDLAEVADAGDNYFYTSDLESGLLARTDKSMRSQFARTRWANVLGRADEWDWAVFPEYEHIRETVQGVGALLPPTIDSEEQTDELRLAETIDAYNRSVEWYLTRTESYFPDTRLQADLEQFVDMCPPGTILDAGAGGGRDTRFMAAKGRTVLAFDLAGELLRRSPLHGAAPRIEGDIRHLPLRPASLAGIWCSAVLLHVPEKQSMFALDEFARAMVRGGRLHITVKHGSGCTTVPVPGQPELRRHFYRYDEQQLNDMVERTGFEVDHMWTDDEPDDSADGITKWLKCSATRSARDGIEAGRRPG